MTNIQSIKKFLGRAVIFGLILLIIVTSLIKFKLTHDFFHLIFNFLYYILPIIFSIWSILCFFSNEKIKEYSENGSTIKKILLTILGIILWGFIWLVSAIILLIIDMGFINPRGLM